MPGWAERAPSTSHPRRAPVAVAARVAGVGSNVSLTHPRGAQPCMLRALPRCAVRKSPLDLRPERRTLRIYAFDPMQERAGDRRVRVEIPYRELAWSERSFADDRLEVVDYDGATGRYYRAIQLDDPRIAMLQGVEPSESDPQFHQQMVYAVASRVLENFDRALGRRLRFWGGERLRLFPHAFQGRNAYFDQALNAVLFGYFPADEDDPGANLPGQPVFTCLSHDIIAHEVSHAALDRLHRHYREATSAHVPALHEAFADIVAIFQRFTFLDVVRDVIRSTRGDLLGRANPLLEVGAQLGAAAGLGAAIRTVAGAPDPTAFGRTTEPHALGRILVSAVFGGFVRTFEARTADLLRIATGGSGRLPEGELYPDLVARLASECGRVAQSVLSMCIRATDYLPPLDPTFSDYLRAMITADFELNRADEGGLRAAMIESFRLHGIRPEAVGSFAVESVLLEPMDHHPDADLAVIVQRIATLGAREMARNTAPAVTALRSTKRARSPFAPETPRALFAQVKRELEVLDQGGETDAEEEPDGVYRDLYNDLWRWARAHAAEIGLEPGKPVKVVGFHPVHRVATSGELLVEMVAELVQTRPLSGDLGGLRYRAGVTLVASIDGRIRYAIQKPFHERREQALRDWVGAFDAAQGHLWSQTARDRDRLMTAFSARAMDGRRWR